MPRPPDTTIEASVNSGRPPFTAGVDAVTVASFALSEIATANSDTAGLEATATA